MKKTKINICGAGTLGGNLAENLVRMGFENITVIDDDVVEKRNLANQPYFFHSIGRPKVKALTENLYLAVGAKVKGVNSRFTLGNGSKLIDGADLVIDTFDNYDSRCAVGQVCKEKSVTCLHEGMSGDGYGEIIWDERYITPPDAEGDPCERPVNRTLSLFVTAIASGVIQRFLEDGNKENYSITTVDMAVVKI